MGNLGWYFSGLVIFFFFVVFLQRGEKKKEIIHVGEGRD